MRTTVAGALLLLVTSPGWSAQFIPLGYLPGGHFSSAAADVSADGRVVVGRSHSATAGLEAFRWTRHGGLVALGDFPGSDKLSDATAVSGNGQVIVGRGTAVFYALVDGFRWTEHTGLELLGYFPRPEPLFTYPSALSFDGSVIIGSSDNRIFRWTEQTGIQEIPAISASVESSYASGISADGTVIAGSRGTQGALKPFRYVAGGVVEELGPLFGSAASTHSSGISANGDVIIGYSGRDGWRWDATTGIEPLPRLVDHDFLLAPVDVSADGSVIVGVTTGSTDPAARFPSFIWTREYGTQNLETFFRDQHGLSMPGWTLTRVSGISDDGMVIVGGGVNPQGRPEAWVVDLRVPEPISSAALLLMLVFTVAGARTPTSRLRHQRPWWY